MNDQMAIQLQGQIQALAQAWLRLAAAGEINGGHDGPQLDDALLNVTWPGQSFEPPAQAFLQGLVDQLQQARSNR